MSQRNYPCDNIIIKYFGGSYPSDFDAVGETVLKKQLWQCMVGQALLLKSDIENRRQQSQFGIIVWQVRASYSSKPLPEYNVIRRIEPPGH